ncbi:OprD family outer membrane porin [Acinetobacter sp. WZC-1]|uniref:OprD family outer membrane porin n=1 Tax=Acinetobacter sp. WZC-1 TaxID=3459034 RepID=UPI00403D6115
MKTTTLCVGICLSPLFLTDTAYAEFIADSKAEVTLRNFYFDRDYKKNPYPYTASRDWAQGLIFRGQSGYTEGPVGLGVDILAMAGFNLLGSTADDYARSSLLPVNADNSRDDYYGKIGITAKAKYRNNELFVGDLVPLLPTIFSSPARLFPQTYRGIRFVSTEIPNVQLEGFYVDEVRQRDSIRYTDVGLDNINRRFERGATTDSFYTLGGTYQLNDAYRLRAYHAELKDIYQQQFLGFNGKQPLNTTLNFLSDVRFFNSDEAGASKIGQVDNRHFSGLFGLNYQNHTLSLGYMQSFGSTGLAILSGTESPVVLDFMSSDYSNKDEKVYSVRYEYDFKDTRLGDVSLNGLRFMTRYAKGEDIDLLYYADQRFKEESVEFDLGYRVPEGMFKGLGLRARFSHYRNDMPTDMTFHSTNETRLNVDYSFKF